jgi:hypothetical protein
LISIFFLGAQAQEKVMPLQYQKSTNSTKNNIKKTRVTLPFIDDFSYDGFIPANTHWEDKQVYINNTICISPPTKGVASFDGLNSTGQPYKPNNAFATSYSDSLTSTPINLSSFTIGSNIFLSFYYQPQGNGFPPEISDSLMLFFKDNVGNWQKVWSVAGTSSQNFKAVILPISTSNYLHAAFQFRFINIASLNSNDDVWNIDYVVLDANRNVADTVLNDIACTKNVNSILKNYTSMPYRQFYNFQVNELQTLQNITIKNNYLSPKSVVVEEKIKEKISNTILSSNTLSNTVILANNVGEVQAPITTINYPPIGYYNKVSLEQTFYYPPINATDVRNNDTIVANTNFDNYFSYDDGTAEKAYFLLPYPNLPAKTALKFHANLNDTVRGMMIHFAPQVPSAINKLFSMILYKELGSNGSADIILAQQDFLKVQYIDTINGFTSYMFDNAVTITPGDYYIGITQPSNLGSDSIYYGLDVNAQLDTAKLNYNVDGTWYLSQIAGNVMMRPIVGLPFVPTSTNNKMEEKITIEIYPNPTCDKIYINTKEELKEISIFSMNGSVVIHQKRNVKEVDCTNITQGNYILKMVTNNNQTITKIICKQ